MKISRSAIVITIAIALVLIAIFATRGKDSPSDDLIAENVSYSDNEIIDISSEENGSAQSAENATPPESGITEADTANLGEQPAPETPQAETEQDNAGEVKTDSEADPLQTEASDKPSTEAEQSLMATAPVPAIAKPDNATAPALPEPESKEIAPASPATPDRSPDTNATQPGTDENIVLLPDTPLAWGAVHSMLAIDAIRQAQLEAEEARLAAEAERLEQARLAEEKAAREKAAKEKAERERLAKEKAEKAAKEKAAKEKAERERLAKEKAEKEKQAQQSKQQEKPSVAVAPTKPGSAGAAPADVMNKLMEFGNKRVSQINRSIAPSKNAREIVRDGEAYIGRYYFVDPSSLSVEAAPASQGSPFKYVGKVRYRECLYEVRAASREEVLKGEGKIVTQRNMCELIQYKNNKWVE